MRRSTRGGVLAVLGVGLLQACFSSQSGAPDADFETPDGTPAADDASPDAPTAPVDAGLDAPVDSTVTPDASPTPEASPEPTEEAAVEAGPEIEASDEAEAASPEAGPDATVDAAVDASVDAPVDAPSVPDAGLDAGPDAAPDASDAATLCIAETFGDHYIRPDGELFYAPGGSHTLVVDGATSSPLLGITEIVQQLDHACGLRASDGTVWCWPLNASGGNPDGDLGNGSLGGAPGTGVANEVVTNAADAGAPTYLTGVVHLSTASDTFYTYPTCAIRSDKSVWCWGYSTQGGSSDFGLFYGTTASINDVPYAIALQAGPADGGPPPPMLADQVSVGARHACLLLAGKVSCWGANVAGNLADGDPSLAFEPYPVPVVTGYGLPATVTQIGSGYDFTCALAGGSVWCWGTNSADEIGDPSAPTNFCNLNYCEPAPTPVQMSGPDGGTTQVPDAGVDQNPLTGITSIVIGYQFGCGLDGSGSLWCWGSGTSYQPLAEPYAPATLPHTNITHLTAYGESIYTALRYTTASGAYVSGNQEITPYCQ